MLADLQQLFAGLNAVHARYLVCGGLAVVAYGHLRVTHDIDLALALDQENLQKCLAVFERLGFKPHLPVSASDFADPTIRRRWQEEKNMQVFSLRAPARKDLVIDLFCDPPFDFDQEWSQSLETTLGPGFPTCRIVSLQTLRTMKRLASRPIDLDDLEHLPNE